MLGEHRRDDLERRGEKNPPQLYGETKTGYEDFWRGKLLRIPFVTPVFMSCYDTLCHDLGSPPGDTSGHLCHLIGSPILYIGYIVYTFYVQYIVRYQIYQTYEVRSLMVAEQSNDLQRKS